jgi:hypothetical protein
VRERPCAEDRAARCPLVQRKSRRVKPQLKVTKRARRNNTSRPKHGRRPSGRAATNAQGAVLDEHPQVVRLAASTTARETNLASRTLRRAADEFANPTSSLCRRRVLRPLPRRPNGEGEAFRPAVVVTIHTHRNDDVARWSQSATAFRLRARSATVSELTSAQTRPPFGKGRRLEEDN